jgi:hypothetical protein
VIDILSYLPAKRKQTSSGWVSFNAPCCIHNNENQDRRQRGGIKVNDQGWSYHCFNCGFTASFVLGRNLSFKARKLLGWLNVDRNEIERINLESLKHRNIEGILNDRQQVLQHLQGIEFEDCDLPADTQPLNELSTQYLGERCIPTDYPLFYKTMPRPGIVIPFTHNGQVVGHTTRFLDDRTPKYIQDIQHGYVFGTDLQQDSWQHVLIMEGVFDALSIGGLAVLHAEINDAQVRLIRSLQREVTVVPDHDEAGMKLVDRALELGWAVSMPNWPTDVKDVNDAVRQYGKAATMLSIFESRNTSRIKIEMAKKNLLRKITCA